MIEIKHSTGNSTFVLKENIISVYSSGQKNGKVTCNVLGQATEYINVTNCSEILQNFK